MTNRRSPGPLNHEERPLVIQDGTLNLMPAPKPGPMGRDHAQRSAQTGPTVRRTQSNDPTLVNRIRHVLAQANDSVQFQAPGIIVNRVLFDAVIQAITSNRSPDVPFLIVRGNAQLPRTPESYVGGSYSLGGDCMLFAFNLPHSIEEYATIVHESIHAALDIFSIRLSIQDSEAVAFIAQELYIRRNLNRNIVLPINRGAIVTAAGAIVSILEQQRELLLTRLQREFPQVPRAGLRLQRELPQVPQAELQSLRDAI